MSLRLIEMFLPEGYTNVVSEALKELDILDIWQEEVEEDRTHIQILVTTEGTETVLDLLEKQYSHKEGFRIVLLPVEATIPRPKPAEKSSTENKTAPPAKSTVSRWLRVSREEL